MYGGRADWRAIARLKDALDVPVLGNGDIWTGRRRAAAWSRATGCDGVVVGRGCLGRPWLFRDLAAAFAGDPTPTPPNLGEVARVMRRHVELLVEAFDGDEVQACRDFRKHVSWYPKGFAVGGETRAALGMVASLAELDVLLERLDLDEPYPTGLPRCRADGPRPCAGWRCPTAGSTTRTEDVARGRRARRLGWLIRAGTLER